MRRLLTFLVILLSILWLVFVLVTYFIGSSQLYVAPPQNLGNSQENLSALANRRPDRPLEFVIFGDTHSSGTFDVLMKKLSGEEFDFMIILGDFAHDPTVECHRFFWDEIRRTGLKCPIFLVAGDEDILCATTRDAATVGMGQYGCWYGPVNFSFYTKDCLFIFLYNVYGTPENFYLDFLEGTLRSRRRGTRHTFVCMHVPPYFVLPEAPPELLEDSPRFFELLSRYNVDYCFSGHEHGYWRGRRNGVDYIKVAGGGGRLQRGGGWGLFHHVMKFSVKDALTEEELIVAPKTRGQIKRVRYFCYIYAYPFWIGHTGIFIPAIVVTVLILILLAWHRLRRSRVPSPGPRATDPE